jgi:hypothetical protein
MDHAILFLETKLHIKVFIKIVKTQKIRVKYLVNTLRQNKNTFLKPFWDTMIKGDHSQI